MPDSCLLHIKIQTPSGVWIRTVPAASPLPDVGEQGQQAEQAIADAASLWGLPDFVYRAGARRKGSGVREIGDRILLVGDCGVAIQVKSRVDVSEDPDKEARWISKNAEKASRQARGTIRKLRAGPVPAINGRGRTVQIGGESQLWIGVVVIDHPQVPDRFYPQIECPTDDLVILLRRDWEFLFDQLKSTRAVISYLAAVRGQRAWLGEEPLRYYGIAGNNQLSRPPEFDPDSLIEGAKMVTRPYLPMAPAGSEDLNAQRFLRIILDDVAEGGGQPIPEQQRLEALAVLDGLPPEYRAWAGRYMLQNSALVAELRSGVAETQFTTPPGNESVIVGACSKLDQDVLTCLVALRHHELQTRSGLKETRTVGVFACPRRDEVRWDTLMVGFSGTSGLSAETVAGLQACFPGGLGHLTEVTSPLFS